MLTKKLEKYVEKFNRDDDEIYINDIDNAHALEWLKENAPLFECPDKNIEEIFYFRLWTLRKHIKNTEDGYIITEFLPKVPWSGKHNTIVAPVGHQINEARWLKHGDEIVRDYALFYLNEIGEIYNYSIWFVHSFLQFASHINDEKLVNDNLDKLIRYYENVHKNHITTSGLYFSYDIDDAMEVSISGGLTLEHKAYPGLRPTLNSYMAADAFALSKIAKKAGRNDIAEKYEKHGRKIVDRMIELLWDGSFFKAIHSPDKDNFPPVNEIKPHRNVRELIGLIPWYFDFMPDGYEWVMRELFEPDAFYSEVGILTAERRHQRFMYDFPHECLWNGYVWPFATTQTLVAVNNIINKYGENVVTKEEFYGLVKTYAKMHYHTKDDGKTVCWIDEVKDPVTNRWSCRDFLKERDWHEGKGGVERGKDYNHSSFCDIILSGLIGITSNFGKIKVEPKVLDIWDYFKVDELYIDGKCYTILYDKTGNHYNEGKGLIIKVK